MAPANQPHPPCGQPSATNVPTGCYAVAYRPIPEKTGYKLAACLRH